MKKGILKMLEALAPEKGGEAEAAPRVSAAERLGQAMLARLGIPEGEEGEELIDALLEEWNALPAPEDDSEDESEDEAPDAEPEEDEPEAVPAGELPEDMGGIDPEELEELFSGSRRPVPMRTGSASSERVDYSDMSPKQFNELKKLIRRASADGRKVRL